MRYFFWPAGGQSVDKVGIADARLAIELPTESTCRVIASASTEVITEVTWVVDFVGDCEADELVIVPLDDPANQAFRFSWRILRSPCANR